jgi:hypothetical protein
MVAGPPVGETSVYEVALAFAVLTYLGICAHFWRSPAYSMFHPLTFYLAFHGVLFVFRPILAYSRDYTMIYRVFHFTPSMDDKIAAIVASTVGLICFTIFILRAGSQPMRFAEDEAVNEERRRLTQIFTWVLVICGPAAIYSMSRNFGGDSVYDGLVMDRATGVAINTKNIGYVTDLQLMGVSLCALIIWLARFRWWAFTPLVVFGVVRAGTGGRGALVTSLVIAGLFYMYEKRLRYPGMRAVIATVAILMAFSAIGQDRGAAVRQAIGIDQKDTFTAAQSTERFMEGMDFGNLEYLEYLIYVIPQRSGTYDYFLDNFQIFTEPVPRVLWTGKPVGEPFRRIALMDYGDPFGMTRSLPGEGWYALGWLGVVIWCSLWGHGLGTLYARFVTGKQSTFRTACYMIFLPTLIVGLRDGLLLTFVRQSGAYLAPVFIWSMLAKYMGVPTAAQLRALLARRMGGQTAPATDRAAPTLAQRRLARLPAAVARRRIMLERSGAGPEGATPAE